uniref:Glutathione S-transferase n=1 Tax=Rhizophora mucronata TaxID=61149 RepID=A0A2P2JJC0_RHIMU
MVNSNKHNSIFEPDCVPVEVPRKRKSIQHFICYFIHFFKIIFLVQQFILQMLKAIHISCLTECLTSNKPRIPH